MNTKLHKRCDLVGLEKINHKISLAVTTKCLYLPSRFILLTSKNPTMKNLVKIYVQNLNRYLDVEGASTLSDIYTLIAPELGFIPINARVNNKSEDLNFRVYHPKTVEFMPMTSASGRRTYVRSLCMMLYHAVYNCYPGCTLSIEHSLSKGYYCRINGLNQPIDQSVADCLSEHMRQLSQRNLPFEYHERRTADVVEIFRKQGLEDKVQLLESQHELYTTYFSLDGLCDTYFGALAPNTGMINTFALHPYKEGLLLMPPDDKDPSLPATPIAQEKMYGAFTDYLQFNRIVGVRNVGELNKAVSGGHSPMLINVAEALHNNRIAAIADEITRRYHEGGARIVMIAGPSSSGKTTTTKRLAIQLVTNLLHPQMISLDDYFVDREKTPRDESGDFDYESLYALDLETFNDHLNRLIAGETVELPYYNFETGMREYRGNKITLGENSILLIEGIHGLNPELTAQIPDKMKFLVYVSALTTISIDDHNSIPTTDNRLLRRIIRDSRYRGVTPEQTIRRWPSVRRGEERWIFPFQENADAMFNSSLLFELGVIKRQGEEVLSQVPRDIPEYTEAIRLRRFLQHFEPISEDLIPSTSLLREFLGGSSFKY